MKKPLLGLLLGGVLGAIDGLTAWFTPEVRDQMVSIVFGSTFKGLVVGILVGWYAHREQSLAKGVLLGFVLAALLAYAVAAMQPPDYFYKIMLPGSLVGIIVGYATQRFGKGREATLRRG